MKRAGFGAEDGRSTWYPLTTLVKTNWEHGWLLDVVGFKMFCPYCRMLWPQSTIVFLLLRSVRRVPTNQQIGRRGNVQQSNGPIYHGLMTILIWVCLRVGNALGSGSCSQPEQIMASGISQFFYAYLPLIKRGNWSFGPLFHYQRVNYPLVI